MRSISPESIPVLGGHILLEPALGAALLRRGRLNLVEPLLHQRRLGHHEDALDGRVGVAEVVPEERCDAERFVGFAAADLVREHHPALPAHEERLEARPDRPHLMIPVESDPGGELIDVHLVTRPSACAVRPSRS